TPHKATPRQVDEPSVSRAFRLALLAPRHSSGCPRRPPLLWFTMDNRTLTNSPRTSDRQPRANPTATASSRCILAPMTIRRPGVLFLIATLPVSAVLAQAPTPAGMPA